MYYNWVAPGSNYSDINIESGFEESCESRGMETVTPAVLMGLYSTGGYEASLNTTPAYYNMSYIGERSGFDISGLYWNKVFGMGQMQGGLWDNLYFANQTQVNYISSTMLEADCKQS